MALSYLGSDSAIGTNANVTVTFGVALQQNDIVFVIGGSRTSNVPAAVTAGYADALAAVNNPTGNEELWVGYKIMGASPDTTFVGVGTSSSTVGIGYVAFYFRGADGTVQPDVASASAIGSSANPDSPSITTTTDGAVILACATSSAKDTAITAPSGYSNNTQANTGGANSSTVAGAWKTVTPAGAENPASWTGWASGNWIAASIAIRPAQDVATTLAGSGGLDAAGLVLASATAAIAGVGQLDAAAVMLAQASAAFAGAGSLAADGTPVVEGGKLGTVAIAGVGSLASSALLLAQASVALAGAGALAAAATHTPSDAAGLAGDGMLGIAETMIAQAVTAIAGIGELDAAGLAFKTASAALVGVGALSAFGTIVVPNGGVVAFGGTGALAITARMKAAGFVALAGDGALIATALQKAQARATLQGVGMLTFNETLVPSTMTIRRASGTPAAIVDRQSGGSSGGLTDRRAAGSSPGAAVERRS